MGDVQPHARYLPAPKAPLTTTDPPAESALDMLAKAAVVPASEQQATDPARVCSDPGSPPSPCSSSLNLSPSPRLHQSGADRATTQVEPAAPPRPFVQQAGGLYNAPPLGAPSHSDSVVPQLRSAVVTSTLPSVRHLSSPSTLAPSGYHPLSSTGVGVRTMVATSSPTGATTQGQTDEQWESSLPPHEPSVQRSSPRGLKTYRSGSEGTTRSHHSPAPMLVPQVGSQPLSTVVPNPELEQVRQQPSASLGQPINLVQARPTAQAAAR